MWESSATGAPVEGVVQVVTAEGGGGAAPAGIQHRYSRTDARPPRGPGQAAAAAAAVGMWAVRGRRGQGGYGRG